MKFCRRTILFVVLSFGCGFSDVFSASLPSVRLRLDDLITQSCETSPSLKQAELDWRSAELASQSQKATLWPRLSFDASYRYQTDIPEFRLVPSGPLTPFGDHRMHSIGPTVTWPLLTSGANMNRWKSFEAVADSKKWAFEAVRIQLILEVKLITYGVLLSLEHIRAVSHALVLAQKQYDDIVIQNRAGSLSQIDVLSFHDEVLTRQRELRQAQVMCAQGLRQLFALSGTGSELNPSVPFMAGLSVPSGMDEPTLWVELDSLETLLTDEHDEKKWIFDDRSARFQSLSSSIEGARRVVRSLESQHGPSVLLTARSSRDYPNGPVLETISQNTIGVAATWPLFEFKRVVHDVEAHQMQTEALKKKSEQTLIDLKQEWNSIRDQLLGLRSEQSWNLLSRDETSRLVRLVYDSYRAGRATYLEVERANYKALVADVRLAQNKVQILIQLAILESLSRSLSHESSRPEQQ